jgi:hypothetical protein
MSAVLLGAILRWCSTWLVAHSYSSTYTYTCTYHGTRARQASLDCRQISGAVGHIYLRVFVGRLLAHECLRIKISIAAVRTDRLSCEFRLPIESRHQSKKKKEQIEGEGEPDTSSSLNPHHHHLYPPRVFGVVACIVTPAPGDASAIQHVELTLLVQPAHRGPTPGLLLLPHPFASSQYAVVAVVAVVTAASSYSARMRCRTALNSVDTRMS